jgi:periplasmic mercuric ion binding protein
VIRNLNFFFYVPVYEEINRFSLFQFLNFKYVIMKTINFFTTAIIAVMLTTGLIGQTTTKSNLPASKTESFKVLGACDMCKTRIEKGLKLDGVTKAVWNEKLQLVTVSYDPAKTSIDNMQKKLASIGHDTEKYKAPDDVYAKLPSCCHYDRSK